MALLLNKSPYSLFLY